MFNNISMAGTGVVGVLVYVLVFVFKWLGLEVAEAELTTQVQNIIGAVSFVVLLVGQYRRRDLSGGLVRKK